MGTDRLMLGDVTLELPARQSVGVGDVPRLDGRRLVETGTHEDLMARGGPYSELYGIQAAAYR